MATEKKEQQVHPTASCSIGPLDVLLGRGSGPNRNPGNVQYRRIIRKHVLRYLELPASQRQDSEEFEIPFRNFAYGVIQDMRERGGRFLEISKVDGKSKKGCFEEVTVSRAILKVIHALRHQVKLERKARQGQKGGRDRENAHSSIVGHRVPLSAPGKEISSNPCTLPSPSKSTEKEGIAPCDNRRADLCTALVPCAFSRFSATSVDFGRAHLLRNDKVVAGGDRYPQVVSSAIRRPPPSLGLMMANLEAEQAAHSATFRSQVPVTGGLAHSSFKASPAHSLLDPASRRRRERELRYAEIMLGLPANDNYFLR